MSTIRVNAIQNTSTTDGGISIDNSGHVSIEGQKLPSAGPLTNRNLIINGAMQVAQRGTQVTGVTASGYRTCDRFEFAPISLGTWTVDQDTNAPDGFSNSFKVTCTTADASPAANDQCFILYGIEAQDLQSLGFGTSGAKATTLSFWVRSNKTGNASIALLQRDNSAKLVSFQYSISSADTWEHKTISIPADTAGVINNDNGEGLQIEWWLNSGSNKTGGSHQAAWSTYDEANRNVSNLGVGGATSDYFQITGVQLEVGEVATPFEHRSYADELRRCQRYFYAHNCADTYNMVAMGFYTGTNSYIGMHTVPVPFRAAPSLSTSGNFQTAHDSGNSTASSIVLADEPGGNVLIQIRCTTSSTPSGEGAFLRNNNDATATFTLSAEL